MRARIAAKPVFPVLRALGGRRPSDHALLCPAMETSSKTEPQESSKAASQVARSTGMMSALILLSRVTGFVRTWAMAFALGNTLLAASFSLANNLPNMIYELVAGGVFSTAFLPIYLQQRNSRSRDAANDYASNLLSISIAALGLLSIAASVFAPQIIVTQSLFSSQGSTTVDNAVWFFRIFAFQIFFYGLNALFSGLLNAERSYFWPSICSVFMNFVQIAAFFAYPFVSAVNETAALLMLGIGTTLSVALMAFVQIPALRRTGFRFRFSIDLHGEGLRATVRLALPAIACTAINLVSLSLANSVALDIADNGPASVNYAKMWYMFPYGVLGVALSTAMFTEMSDALSRNDVDRFKKGLAFGLRNTLSLIIPMAALLFVCATEFIGLYAAGRFTAADVEPIASLLRAWALTLPLYAGYMYLYRAFSALKDMKTVVIFNAMFTVVQALAYMIAGGVIVLGDHGVGLRALAVGDAIFYALMVVALLRVLVQRVGSFDLRGILSSVWRVSLASVAGGAIAMLIELVVGQVLDTLSAVGAFVTLAVSGIVGLAAIAFFCKLLKETAIMDFIGSIFRRVRR